MRLELCEFVQAAAALHQRSGIKRTRLMMHLRPHSTRKTFTIKFTDGATTLTTRVAHQGQLKLVEALVTDFVSRCTVDTMPLTVASSSRADCAHATPLPSQPAAHTNKGSHSSGPQHSKGKSGKKGRR